MAKSDDEGEAICFSCSEPLPDDGTMMTCTDCRYSYHLGSCSGVLESTYKSKGAKRKNWKCPTCVTVKSRGNQASVKQKHDLDIGAELEAINRKLSELMSIKEKVDSLLSIKETVDKMEHSVEMLSEKYDDVLSQLKRQDRDITSLRKRVEELENSDSAKEIKNLKKEVNELEQYGRRQNLEVHGIPQSENENLLTKLNDVAVKLSLAQLTERDVEAIHRLPSKPDKIPVVLVRFSSRGTKETWLSKKREIREARHQVYFHENLTRQNKKLLWMAKTKAEEMHFRFVWTANGKLFARKRPGDRVIKIECEDDLAKMT